VQEKAGFVPNVFLAFAHRPAEFRAFFAYHDALLLRESGLTKGEKEMIIVATSGANQCLYCVVAHGALLRIYEKKPLVADQVAVNYRKADISDRQKAMLAFAMKVCNDSAAVVDATAPVPSVVRSTVASWITMTTPSRLWCTSSSMRSLPSAMALWNASRLFSGQRAAPPRCAAMRVTSRSRSGPSRTTAAWRR